MWETKKNYHLGMVYTTYLYVICQNGSLLFSRRFLPGCDFLSCPPFAFLNLRYCGRNLQYMPRAIRSDTAAVENVEVGSGRQEVPIVLTIQES